MLECLQQVRVHSFCRVAQLGECFPALVVVGVELAGHRPPCKYLCRTLADVVAALRVDTGDDAGGAVVDRKRLVTHAEEGGNLASGRGVPAVVECPPARVKDDQPGLAVLVDVAENLR
jgi:hypothetical protein